MEINELSAKLEKVSQLYASEFDITRDQSWFILKLQEEMGEMIQAYLMMTGQARRKDKSDAELRDAFHEEVADVLCHTLLLAKQQKINLEKEVANKWLVRLKSDRS